MVVVPVTRIRRAADLVVVAAQRYPVRGRYAQVVRVGPKARVLRLDLYPQRAPELVRLAAAREAQLDPRSSGRLVAAEDGAQVLGRREEDHQLMKTKRG